MSSNVHVFRKTTDPVAAPTDLGQHWVNTVNGKHFLSNGTATVANWEEQSPDTGITELTGDVTAGPGNGSQAATIANLAVTNAKVATGIDAAKLADGSVSNTELQYINSLTSNAQTQLDAKVDENAAIVGATKTKITYDAKGLVTAGADATTADIADSTNKRYVTDADLVDIGNLSGTNSGDQDLSGLVPYTGATANLNLGTFGLTDSLSALSVDANVRKAYGVDGTTVEMDWSKVTYSYGVYLNTLQTDNIFPATSSSVSFGSGGDVDVYLRDIYFSASGSRFFDSGNFKSFEANIFYRQLFDFTGSYPSVDFGTYELLNIGITNGGGLLRWSVGEGGVKIYQGGGPTLIGDFVNGGLYSVTDNLLSLNFSNRTASDNTGSTSVDWDYHLLQANYGVTSYDWQNRIIYASDGVTAVLNHTTQQPSSGAQTAGGTYTATEQTMIQEMYDALRVYGLLS